MTCECCRGDKTIIFPSRCRYNKGRQRRVADHTNKTWARVVIVISICISLHVAFLRCQAVIACLQDLFGLHPCSRLSYHGVSYELASKLWRAAGEAMLVATKGPQSGQLDAGKLKVLTPVMQNDDLSGDFFFCV